MPPADNTNTPAPAPAPESPKKQGFWAKLFGKKSKDEAVVPPRESQTPQPALDDNTSRDTVTPPEGTAVTSPNGNPSGPELSQPVPTVGADEEPQTLDVPSDVSAKPVESDEGPVAPTLPTQPEGAGESQQPNSPEEPKEGSPSNPVQ